MKPPIEVKVPVENVNDVTARLLHWRKESGATVKEGDLLAEMETTKAVFEVHAPAEGVLQYSWDQEAEVPVGETLCRIYPDGLPDKTEIAATDSPVAEGQIPEKATVFSRGARALIAESKLDESIFAGIALVTEADVRAKLGTQPTPRRSSTPAEPVVPPAPPKITPPSEEGEITPLERAKLYENRELLAASRSVLKSTLFQLCPAAGMQQACARQTPPTNRLAIILFETARLLGKFRSLNACFQADAILAFHRVNIGFAVDMGHGLKVLVIRGAEKLGFDELSAKVDDLLVSYSTNTLAVADVTGSTFTVTDLSGTGVFTFDPLINTNQAAILGIAADHPGGFILSCSFDHRINGGRVVGEFLSELSTRLVAHAKSLQREEEKVCALCLQPASLLRKRGHMLLVSIEPPGCVCSICLSGN